MLMFILSSLAATLSVVWLAVLLYRRPPSPKESQAAFEAEVKERLEKLSGAFARQEDRVRKASE